MKCMCIWPHLNNAENIQKLKIDFLNLSFLFLVLSAVKSIRTCSAEKVLQVNVQM